MSRRITTALLGTVIASLIVVGAATVLLARAASIRQSLAELSAQVQRTNELIPVIGAIGGRSGAGGTGSITTLPPTTIAAPTTLAPAGPERQAQRRAERQAQREAEQQARRRATAAARAEAGRATRRQLLEALNVSGIGEVVISDTGEVSGSLPDGVARSDLDADGLQSGRVQTGRNRSVLWAAAARPAGTGGPTGTVVTILTRPQEPIAGPTLRWYLLAAGISIVVAAGVSLWLGRRLAHPVRLVVQATRAVADGDLSVRVPVPKGAADDELVILSRTVNSMADQLGRAKDAERQFLMSVSHDLRTPMTSIRGYAEAITDGATDPLVAAEVIRSESRRLERLVGDLLDLARLDADRFDLDLTEADLTEVTRICAEGFEPEAAELGVTLDFSGQGPAPGRIDLDRYSQVIGNLLGNALSYATESVRVTVVRRDFEASRHVEVGRDLEVSRHVEVSKAGRIEITITDDGPGMDEVAARQVFDRLYRGDNQSSRRHRGTGLGLAIVAELVSRMGGTAGVRSRPGHGSTFVLSFPAV